jgi:hypothetical protein
MDNLTLENKLNESISLALLQNHSNLRTGQDQVLWSIFGAFWTANSLLLVSIFTSDASWNKSKVGIIISLVGILISCVWSFIQKRALRRLVIYENAIKLIEKNLNLPINLCAFYNENESTPPSKVKINARTIMVLFSYLSIILWLTSLLVYLLT